MIPNQEKVEFFPDNVLSPYLRGHTKLHLNFMKDSNAPGYIYVTELTILTLFILFLQNFRTFPTFTRHVNGLKKHF